MDIARDDQWDIVIKPKEKGIHLHLKEVWRYKDLLYLYVKRDFISAYKQTILGPLWFFIQPIFSTLIYTLVFGGIAQISTDGLPPMLFYMSGILCWNFFSDCLGRSSGTFSGNAGVFSKVYFPRLVVPIAGLASAVLKMFIQMLLFFSIYAYFLFTGSSIGVTVYILLFPLLVIMLAGIAFGVGILISSVTIKYRDLNILFSFAIGLIMYITPIIYPLSAIPAKYSAFKWVIQLNPLSSVVEAFRFGMLGTGELSWGGLLYSSIFTFIIVLLGIIVFNKVERRFIDIV
ncbi:lipopolysaccharide transport system permease protein [Dysgonomonas alginatilytica]|uniref:Transport permease protein n=1 Tax=Dysgonomonas alginatilytica TaxID=1605892 RepID=A0A2V3PQP4_9BACT|nr:ABC transporter permease [Dysgonomonas alginatilytica]PXV64119.1 lipopolysaccharide transport system permease protein [Dysgonomonas alginatilytica]